MRSLPNVTLALLVVSALAACTTTPEAAIPEEVPHGFVEGATESAEPQLHLATVDSGGTVMLFDLLSEENTKLETLTGTTSLSTDGRFLFASTDSGLEIIDTGVWTVDHEDHSHYYRAAPTVVGTLDGAGVASVAGGTTLTGVWFGETGTGIVLDSAALGAGSIDEVARIDGEPHVGHVVPFGEGLLVTEATNGAPSGVRAYDASGEPLGAAADCADLAGTISTRVGQVFGCRDGALLVTRGDDGGPVFETIPYPTDVAPGDRATEFRARPGRPSVAAVAGTTGAWLLDTRERTWTHLPTEVPLLLVAAADDRDGNIVALAVDGRVLVLDAASGATVAATEPLLATTVADPSLLPGLELTVDSNRAYLNAPAEGLVYEIDYADHARIARTFGFSASPVFLAETGR